MLDSEDNASYTSLSKFRKDSLAYASSSNEFDSSQSISQFKQPVQRFTSNMCAVLNDPRKDRNKVNYLFTKTWGNDFSDNSTIPSIKTVHSNYSVLKKIEFNEYINLIAERHLRHLKNKTESSTFNKNIAPVYLSKAINGAQPGFDLEIIPKIFFDSKFSLNNKDTFNTIISLKLCGREQTLNKSNDNKNPFLSNQAFLNEAESFKEILEKLSYYLDIAETHISRQISTKANTFFHAMTSQDEVQEHILKTCTAVKCLRKNIINLDERLVLSSIRAIKLVHLRVKYRSLIEKLELMSFVYKTQPTIQLHLSSSEFTGALDLIAMSKEILRQDLRGIRSLRHYDSQFIEIEKAIDKILHQEFIKYIISDLSRLFSDSSDVLNEEKLCSLMLGIIRIKISNFVELCKDEIFVYLKSTVKQTIIEYISQLDDDSNPNPYDDNNVRLIDQVKQLKIQEFLHLLSRVLTNVRTMLGRVKSIVTVLFRVLNSVAGIKNEDNLNSISNKELLTKENHSKLTTSLKEMLTNSCDYAQERLVNLLEGKFRENGIEKLNSNDFISLSNLIDQFIIDFDLVVDKKTSTLRSWIQNQATKFLHKFHHEKKDKLNLALESERWKQYEIPIDFKNLVEHIIINGIGSQSRKFDSKVKNASDFILINNEKYVIFGTVIVLIKLMVEYCQFSNEIPNLRYDVMTRAVEIFKIFNAKTYQMILGGGAVHLSLLRIITFKTLAITHRCLELVLLFLPLLRDFFLEKLPDKQTNLNKQFTSLIKDYNEHKCELKNKVNFMIDENFREFLTQYEVIAPVPSQCFRSICQQITRVHEIFSEILSDSTVTILFTEIHLRFKQRLSQRLKELNVKNDGGPQHALICSDMSYYIKQFKSLDGLHLISLNFEDVFN